jgi:hypothetical protein
MALNKNQPKLADSLSVFVEQMQKNEKATKLFEIVVEKINSKIDTLYQYQPKIDLAPLQKQNHEFIKTLDSTKNRINSDLDLKIQEVKELISRKESDSTFMKVYTISIFLAITMSIIFSIKINSNTQESLQILKESQTEWEQKEKSFFNYLKENNEIKKYKKWVEK